jgi:MFS family permease
VIIVVGPIAGRLTDRIGPRPLMTLGLLVVAGSMFWQGHLSADTSYGFLVGAFVLMGLGMGLVMSPMSTAAMNAVEHTKAGVASGILSMSRMVGGTFGVAAMGALVSGLGKSRIDTLLPNVPADQRSKLADSLGAGGTQVGGQVGSAVSDAFVYALNNGLRLAALIAALGALLTWMLIADKPAPATAPEEIAPDIAVAAPAGEVVRS